MQLPVNADIFPTSTSVFTGFKFSNLLDVMCSAENLSVFTDHLCK